MVEFTIPKDSFVVSSIRRGRITDISETGTTNTPEVLGDPLAWIQPLSTITPLEWDCTYGLSDDPLDELAEWMLAAVDIEAVPTLTSVRALSIWWRAQQWRSIGTDSGPVQTLTQDSVDFLNPESYNYLQMAGFTQRYAVCCLIVGSVASDFRTVGVLTYQEDLIQRVFGGDGWTFEDPDHSEFGDEWGNDETSSG